MNREQLHIIEARLTDTLIAIRHLLAEEEAPYPPPGYGQTPDLPHPPTHTGVTPDQQMGQTEERKRFIASLHSYFPSAADLYIAHQTMQFYQEFLVKTRAERDGLRPPAPPVKKKRRGLFKKKA